MTKQLPAPFLPPGFGVEAAFALADGRQLVFATLDCPYEEELLIVLADANGQVIARRRLGGAYTPGILTGVERQGPDSFTFRFPDQQGWLVSVAPAGRSWLTGWWRPALRVERRSQPVGVEKTRRTKRRLVSYLLSLAQAKVQSALGYET